MKNPYSQAILLFGIIIPVALLSVAMFTINYSLASHKKDLGKKSTKYNDDILLIQQTQRLQRDSRSQNATLSKWKTNLKAEPSIAISTSLKQSGKEYGKELMQTSFSPSRSRGLASKSPIPNSSWDFALRGSFRSIQKTFLSLEKKNPNLMLESLSIKPNKRSNNLTTTVSYSAWQLTN